MARKTRMGLTGGVLRGLDALTATSGADAPPAVEARAAGPAVPARGHAPDPDRAQLVPVLYRVLPEDRDALREEAARRAREARRAADEERRRARAEGRRPRLPVVRDDASEVLREILAAWRAARAGRPAGESG